MEGEESKGRGKRKCEKKTKGKNTERDGRWVDENRRKTETIGNIEKEF